MSEVKEKYENSLTTGVGHTMGERVLNYNAVVRSSVNLHYPVLHKKIKRVPDSPWFDSEYKEPRKQRRKAEKKYKKTHHLDDKETFLKL